MFSEIKRFVVYMNDCVNETADYFEILSISQGIYFNSIIFPTLESTMVKLKPFPIFLELCESCKMRNQYLKLKIQKYKCSSNLLLCQFGQWPAECNHR